MDKISARGRTVIELFRARPVSSSLLSVVPLVLAVGQLWNSYVNDVSPLIAVGFTLAMLGFTVVALGHHAAAYRLWRLESGVERQGTGSRGPF
ncbi:MULTISPECIES: hypothetical protein [Natrialba]|uniref:Uncharacterized protein n=2 Tax=Natrialba TaxID=63742 RepID=M0B4Q6_9EURY|nr:MULTISPECIES: hypothetical protein [Natrialba]ELY95375.1 hypothetical protein C484_03770 [Natrialba taiwanensis DSM 12281]ELZ04624.1 hypothetical protein C480_13966 [Natrialba aegyptia DSM 13077]